MTTKKTNKTIETKTIKETIRKILNKIPTLDYEQEYSHYHCWDQDQPPACGQPLEKHTICCLCSLPYLKRNPK